MGVKKLKDLFSTKKPHRPVARHLKKVDKKVEVKGQDSAEVLRENQRAKAEIQQLKDSIQKKLRDPKMAQKAAAILSDYVNNKKK